MSAVLLAGVTHYPPLSMPDMMMTDILRRTLADPTIPDIEKDPTRWPQPMQDEWAHDEGTTAAATHRAALVSGLNSVRAELDAFQPDVVLIFGDDQHENFQEDLIPPFAVLAYDDLTVLPWAQAAASAMTAGKANVWDEPPTTERIVKGHRTAARFLVEALINDGFDVAYAYRQLHHPGLSHAFLNTVMYLDYERSGFPWPVIAMPVNCYGRKVVGARGFMTRFDERPEPDPPSPSPRRLMSLGGAIVRAAQRSPWRVAIVASSSWSHAFLCDHTWRLRPDTIADRALYDALVAGDYAAWESVSLDDIEHAGQQEVLNWFILLGAARAADAELAWSTFVETSCFNSNKVFALWHPVEGMSP